MRSGSDIRVYRISPWRRGMFAGLGMLLILPLLIWGIFAREAAGLVCSAIMTAIWAPCYYLVHSARLILSSEGVQFKQMGYRLESSWENVVRLWLLKGQEGFELAQPMHNFSARLLSGTADSQFVVQGALVDPVPGEARRGLVVARQFIPIEAFAYWIERGDLLDEIQRFAPRLAENRLSWLSLSQDPTGELQKTTGTGEWILIGSIIVAAVIFGGLLGADVLPLNVQWGAERIIRAITFVCLSAYAVFNFTWSVRHARSGRWGRAALAAVFGMLQVLFCIVLVNGA